MSGGVKKSATMHRGYLGGQAGVPVLRRTAPEYQTYETGYFQGGFYAGYDRVLVIPKSPRWLAEGSLRLEADYYYLGGDEGNLGSHKHQWSALGGWKQRFDPFFDSGRPVRFFVDPMAGFGIAGNRLNFGRGFPLDQETSLNFLARLGGGVEYCFHDKACFAIKAGYDIERSLTGLGYFQRGWRVGPELEVNLFGSPIRRTDICWQQLNEVRDDLASCEASLRDVYDELAALHGQIRSLLADNVLLNEAIQKQVAEYKKECRDPNIAPPDLETKIDDLKPFPDWKWADRECRGQLEAANAALRECQSQELNQTRDRLAEKLAEVKKSHNDLVGQWEEVVRWIYQCRKPGGRFIRTPKSILLFANDSADLATQQQKFFDKPVGRIHTDLDDWIVYLSRPENKRIQIRIHGYANDTGDENKNLLLAEARAENVRQYLTKTDTGPKAKYGPTLVPAEDVPAYQRNNCVAETTTAGLQSAYCPVHMDSERVDFSKGYGSDPRTLEKLRARLGDLGIVVTEADTQHPIYRMVWLEFSDEEGNFK